MLSLNLSLFVLFLTNLLLPPYMLVLPCTSWIDVQNACHTFIQPKIVLRLCLFRKILALEIKNKNILALKGKKKYSDPKNWEFLAQLEEKKIWAGLDILNFFDSVHIFYIYIHALWGVILFPNTGPNCLHICVTVYFLFYSR